MAPELWRTIATSVAGTSHAKNQTPCQDAHLWTLIEGPEDVLVLAASDGAGSASHSEEGSKLACQELVARFRCFVESGKALASLERNTVQSWLEEIAALIKAEAQSRQLASRDFACTLLAAAISPTHAAYVQIGDGAIVVRSGELEWAYVFWPQHGEYINTTVFLTDPTALKNFQFECAEDEVKELAVFTDGLEALLLHYASQTVHSPFFNAMFPALRALPESGHSIPLSMKLAEYLESPAICSRTDDDKTLLLASRWQTQQQPDACCPK
ncbi:Uncharacterised protein [Bordetella ansorpii]|uniref:PPM-type phosphatase domain-containing protein n=1 Tax=Bordetella ansorpii TaxID=288768 RepID=A0A157SGD6_9BORD|nr:PP2C family serine/threonine-protein phosphatase [Bordetella ansorpii]SAI69495.1 Uncharacterised protein [Bordetella ansorpii]